MGGLVGVWLFVTTLRAENKKLGSILLAAILLLSFSPSKRESTFSDESTTKILCFQCPLQSSGCLERSALHLIKLITIIPLREIC